jgi:hypothetical protein
MTDRSQRRDLSRLKSLVERSLQVQEIKAKCLKGPEADPVRKGVRVIYWAGAMRSDTDWANK